MPTTTMPSEKIVKSITKWGGASVIIITIFAALFAGVRYIINSEVQSLRGDVGMLTKEIGELKGANQKTNNRIDDLLKEALERTFPAPSSSKKTISETLPQIRGILQLATNRSLKLNPELLARYGSQVAQVANYPRVTQNALDVLGDLMACRSVVNSESVPVRQSSLFPLSRAPEVDIQAEAKSFLPNGALSSVTFTVTRDQVVPADRSFVYTKIGTPSTSSKGFAFLSVDGHNQTEFRLDGHQIRQVIFRNARIEYDGGSVHLENVYFINCSFDIKPNAVKTDTLQAFTDAVLSSPSATFSVS